MILKWLNCRNNNIEMVKLLIDYANKNNIILEFNEKNKKWYYPLLLSCRENNIEILYYFRIEWKRSVWVLSSFMIFRIEWKSSVWILSSFMIILKLVQLLIDYANKNNII